MFDYFFHQAWEGLQDLRYTFDLSHQDTEHFSFCAVWFILMGDIIFELVDDVLTEIPVYCSFELAPSLLIGLSIRSLRDEALDLLELLGERLLDDILVLFLEVLLLSHHQIL